MRLGGKLSGIFFGLLGLAVSITAFSVAIGWTTPLEQFLRISSERDARLSIAAVSLVMILWAIYFIFSIFPRKEKPKSTTVTVTDLGQIHITSEAIENFVARATANIKGVYEVKPKIKILQDGVALLLKVAISPDINLPSTASEVQEKVAKHLVEFGGVKVLEIEVVVGRVQHPNKSRVD